MPYRRLPNTDSARLKALQTALSKGREISPKELAFSQKNLQKIQAFLTKFEKAITLYKQAHSKQVENNKDFQKVMKKARLFISHFVQVLNMAITRAELSPSTRTYFGINEDNNKLPPLSSEKDLETWGKKIIEGESSRKLQGQNPITNPTIAVVKVRYEKFLEAQRFQKILKEKSERSLSKLSELRDEADEIILNIWNEVESTFEDLPDKVKRERATLYGVTYVYRKNENNNIIFQDTRHKNTG